MNSETIVEELKKCVADERRNTRRIIELLESVERLRIYAEMGYFSMFEFVTQELGYSESAAQRRINVMRLCRSVPEAKEKIEKGVLSLTVASRAQSVFREAAKDGTLKSENALEQTINLSKNVHDNHPKRGVDKAAILTLLENKSQRQAEQILATTYPQITSPAAKQRVIGPNKIEVKFVADEALLKDLSRIRGLLAHKFMNPAFGELIKYIAQLALRQLDPAARQLHQRHQNSLKISRKITFSSTQISTTTSTKTRYLSRQLRSQIWSRDQGRCSFVSPATGKKCGSTFALEIDHVIPLSQGGTNDEGNLRLLCRTHNQWEAARKLGAAQVQDFWTI